jgi:hypothetical protein
MESGKYDVMAWKVHLLDECASSMHGFVKVHLIDQMSPQTLEYKGALFFQTYTLTSFDDEIMSN